MRGSDATAWRASKSPDSSGSSLIQRSAILGCKSNAIRSRSHERGCSGVKWPHRRDSECHEGDQAQKNMELLKGTVDIPRIMASPLPTQCAWLYAALDYPDYTEAGRCRNL